MAVCDYKRFKRTQLCTGDLNKYGAIYERVLQAATIDEDEATIQFDLLKNVWFGIETLTGINAGSQRFNGVSIAKDATHLFYLVYDPELPLLDVGNYFIEFNGRYFRILSVTNENENDYFLILQASERGDQTQAATEA